MPSVVFIVQLKLSNKFFDCHFACFVWNTVYITFRIQPPTSFVNLFGSWLHRLRSKLQNQILLEAAALCLPMWLNMNNMVFNKARSNTVIKVIFRVMFWIQQWSMLHREKERPLFKEGCRNCESLIMAILAKFGLSFKNRIDTNDW